MISSRLYFIAFSIYKPSKTNKHQSLGPEVRNMGTKHLLIFLFLVASLGLLAQNVSPGECRKYFKINIILYIPEKTRYSLFIYQFNYCHNDLVLFITMIVLFTTSDLPAIGSYTSVLDSFLSNTMISSVRCIPMCLFAIYFLFRLRTPIKQLNSVFSPSVKIIIISD